MMKRLLASTALVSILAFSAGIAHAGITIGGDSKMSYEQWSDDAANVDNSTVTQNDSKFVNESHIVISTETVSDAGLTYGTYFRIEAETGNGTSSNLKEDGHRFYVKGDFGEVRLGGGPAGDTFYLDITEQTENENNTGVSLPFFGYKTGVSGAAGDEVVTYYSPSVSGLAVGISYGDAGSTSAADTVEFGASYSAELMDGALKLTYGNGSQKKNSGVSGKIAATSMGVTYSKDQLGVALAFNTHETESAAGVTSSKASNQGVAVTYQVNDNLKLGLSRIMSEDTADAIKGEASQTALSATYTVTTGLTSGFGYTSWDGNTAGATAIQSGTYSSIFMKATF